MYVFCTYLVELYYSNKIVVENDWNVIFGKLDVQLNERCTLTRKSIEKMYLELLYTRCFQYSKNIKKLLEHFGAAMLFQISNKI